MAQLNTSETTETPAVNIATETVSGTQGQQIDLARKRDHAWREARLRSLRGQTDWLERLPDRISRWVFVATMLGIFTLALVVNRPDVIAVTALPTLLFGALVVGYVTSRLARAAARGATDFLREIVVRRGRNDGVELGD